MPGLMTHRQEIPAHHAVLRQRSGYSRGLEIPEQDAGARIDLQKQKIGPRGQAASQFVAYRLKPKDALRAKRPCQDIAASRAA